MTSFLADLTLTDATALRSAFAQNRFGTNIVADPSEIAALHDTGHFADRAQSLYGYRNFVCDSGGSICEVVDPDDSADPVLRDLAANVLMIWIRGDETHRAELVRRFDRAPKPIYYQPAFLRRVWDDYLIQTGKAEAEVDPDAFLRHAYAALLDHRQPRYAAMAANWGVTVDAADVAQITSPDDFVGLVARALEQRR